MEHIKDFLVITEKPEYSHGYNLRTDEGDPETLRDV